MLQLAHHSPINSAMIQAPHAERLKRVAEQANEGTYSRFIRLAGMPKRSERLLPFRRRPLEVQRSGRRHHRLRLPQAAPPQQQPRCFQDQCWLGPPPVEPPPASSSRLPAWHQLPHTLGTERQHTEGTRVRAWQCCLRWVARLQEAPPPAPSWYHSACTPAIVLLLEEPAG